MQTEREAAARLMVEAMRRAEEAVTQDDRDFWLKTSAYWAERA